ncbi:VOC family protein [Trujillonella endophytica]|uniref:Glyoxalase/Bleomycin resistance protein/Dioxygenase superfamily protein n=1 Tax=Trujillonella endophytica TaxID=673521 RepID=A0A1H8UPJ5_9ACTN|nr:VOC family protein [Trujillella endophytica]SEP04903.1 Glyoxalase/Bleomycin resistance protein/Dioxygenase superfamily protein [Trujillella endophytica]
MRAGDLYHVGIVTDDLDGVRDEMSELLGYEWTQEVTARTAVCLLGVDTALDLRLVYSRTTPRVELVASLPGNPVWTPAGGSGVHHLGYWSDDLAADRAELEERGFVAEALGQEPGGPAMWGYFAREGAPRIELVSRAMQEYMEQSWRA